MSLGIAFKGPEGIVLAADSRVTLNAEINQPGVPSMLIPATFDNATKLLKVNGQEYVGAITYGVGAIGTTQPRTAHSFLPEIEDVLKNEGVDRLPVREFAKRLSDFFMQQWREMMPQPYPAGDMIFLVAGFDEGDAYGKVFEVIIPSSPEPSERNANEGDFGITWGGQLELTQRLFAGFDPNLPGITQQFLGLTDAQREQLSQEYHKKLGLGIPYQFLPLQDCVDLSIFMIRTTIELQAWYIGVRGVGGAIDVATITRTDGFTPVQEKKVVGEGSRRKIQ